METTPSTPPLIAHGSGPSRRFRRVRGALVASAVLVGTVSSLVAWGQADDAAERDTAALAQRASDLVASRVDTIRSGLAGAGSLVQPDGSVSSDEFRAYATEVVSASALSALALVPVVPATERQAFEDAVGRRIVDRGPEGVMPAPVRRVHYPVRVVVPATSANEALLGFDIAGDPVRHRAAQAARDSAEIVISEPVPSQPTGSTSFFVTQALYRPDADLSSVAGRRRGLVGFVSTAYTGESLAQGLVADLPPGTEFALLDAGVLLASSPGDPPKGEAVPVPAATRTWSLVVGRLPADHGLAVWLAIITGLVASGLAIVLRRTERHEREIRDTVALITHTTQLAQAIAAARTVDEVKATVREHLPGVLGVDAAGLATVDRDAHCIDLPVPDLLALTVARPDGTVSLDAAVPLAEVVHSGRARFLATEAEWQSEAPAGLIAGADASGLGARAYCPLCVDEGEVVAVLVLTWSPGADVGPAVRSTVATVAEICQYGLTRALTTDQATRRASELAVLAERLAAAQTLEAVAEVVTTWGRAPVEAAATSIGIIEGGALRIEHGPTVPADYRRRFSRPSLEEPLAFTEAARTGQPLVFEDQAAYDQRYPTAQGPQMGARAAFPLHDTTGTTIGAIAHLWPSARAFDDALVSTLATIAELTGQAIERARLFGKIRADAQRSEALAELGEVLARARTVDEVANAVAHRAGGAVGAHRCNLALPGPGSTLRLWHPPDVPAAMADKLDALAHDGRLPHVAASLADGPLVFTSVEALATSYPEVADLWTEAGSAVGVYVALHDGAGQPLGTLGLFWPGPITIGEGVEEQLLADVGDVAELVAQALERARLADAEHRLVTSVQDSVLAPLPEVASLASAGRYLPAARAIGMGGDWYEGMVLDDGRYAIVVGDVAGHGITAVGQMAQFRAVIGALVRIDTPLEAVFPLVTEVVQGEEPIASALLVVIDPVAGQLRYVAAGHLPPLVRYADGSVVALGEGRQSLLGVPADAAVVGRSDLPLGATLLCYTDGLVERRGEPIDVSVSRLAAHLSRLGDQPPALLADDLIAARLEEQPQDDDIALAIVHRRA